MAGDVVCIAGSAGNNAAQQGAAAVLNPDDEPTTGTADSDYLSVEDAAAPSADNLPQLPQLLSGLQHQQ
eukprot:274586-Alexandrium_andersonii.AAC.1